MKEELANARQRIEQQTQQLAQKETRIAGLEKVKITTEIQEKFTKLAADNKEYKKKIKALEKEKAGGFSSASSSSSRVTRSSAASASSAAPPAANAEEVEDLKLQLEEEKTHKGKIEDKLRKYATWTKEKEVELAAAEAAAKIVVCALGREGGEEAASVASLAEDVEELTMKLNEAGHKAVTASSIATQNERLNEEKATLATTVTEMEGQLATMSKTELELKNELATATSAVEELTERLEAADKAGEAGSRETNSALNEQKRQVKFLEQENLQLMLEIKDVKKQASTARAELEAFHKRGGASSAGASSAGSNYSASASGATTASAMAAPAPAQPSSAGGVSATPGSAQSNNPFASAKGKRSAEADPLSKENTDLGPFSSNSRSNKKSRRANANQGAAFGAGNGATEPVLESLGDENPGECKQS